MSTKNDKVYTQEDMEEKNEFIRARDLRIAELTKENKELKHEYQYYTETVRSLHFALNIVRSELRTYQRSAGLAEAVGTFEATTTIHKKNLTFINGHWEEGPSIAG